MVYFNPKPSVPAKKRGVTKSKQKRKRNISPIRSLDDVQMISEYFWDKKQYRNWCLFNVGIATGLRASDLLKLKVSDMSYCLYNGKIEVVEDAGTCIVEEKTSKYREIILTPEARDIVETYIKIANLGYDDWMFPSRQGSWKKSLRTNGGDGKTGIPHIAEPKKAGDPIDVDSFARILRNAGRDLNLNYKIASHSCRKTFGYREMCLNKDDNQALSWIQGQLNHSSQDITLRYVGFDEDKAKEFYKRDDRIDELFNQVKEELVACLKEGKKDTDACVDLLMVAKYLERIGDHAVNISEWEVFKETGSIKNERIL